MHIHRNPRFRGQSSHPRNPVYTAARTNPTLARAVHVYRKKETTRADASRFVFMRWKSLRAFVAPLNVNQNGVVVVAAAATVPFAYARYALACSLSLFFPPSLSFPFSLFRDDSSQDVHVTVFRYGLNLIRCPVARGGSLYFYKILAVSDAKERAGYAVHSLTTLGRARPRGIAPPAVAVAGIFASRSPGDDLRLTRRNNMAFPRKTWLSWFVRYKREYPGSLAFGVATVQMDSFRDVWCFWS